MKTVRFNSDGYTLVGTLHLPTADAAPFVIGCHGLMADRNSPKQVDLAQACCRQGIGYFRFDHRGCGDSQGAFNRVTSLEGRQKDLLDAIQLVRSLDICNGTIGLFGSSLGGAVCLSVGHKDQIKAMVTLAAPLHSRFPQAENHSLKAAFDITEEAGQAKNILIFHGECDEVVPLSHARSLYERASQPKKLMIQPGGDHRMSDPRHQELFIRASVGWFTDYFR
jgi:alpha-beta hydrolase superfamily lysophospholipase